MSENIIIAGPAYAVHQWGTGAGQTATFLSREDISVSIEKATKERTASHIGKFDEILLSVKAVIKFTPLEWDNISALFPWLNMTRGAQLFGATDRYTKIYSADGKCYTFKRTAVSKSASINAGVEKDLLGDVEITALRASGATDYDSDSALYTVESATYAPPALQDSKIFSIPYNIKYGDVLLESEEGISIEPSVQTTEVKNDRVGIWDMIFGGVEIVAKFKPVNITQAQYDAIAIPTGGVKRGRSLKSQGKTLEIYGGEVGDPKFTLTSAVCAGNQTLTFSATAQRFGELEFRALSSSASTPKLTIGTVEAAPEGE